MKNPVRKLFAATLLLSAFAQAQAGTTADFSYNFVDGETLNGVVVGDLVGGNLINITSIQAWFNGTAIAGGGTLYDAVNLPDYTLSAGGAQFSFNFDSNNFFISDQADPNSSSITESFSLFTAPDGSNTTMAYGNLVTGATTADTFFNDGSGLSISSGAGSFFSTDTGLTPQWNLTVVPEPGIMALLALGFGSLMLSRRRKS